MPSPPPARNRRSSPARSLPSNKAMRTHPKLRSQQPHGLMPRIQSPPPAPHPSRPMSWLAHPPLRPHPQRRTRHIHHLARMASPHPLPSRGPRSRSLPPRLQLRLLPRLPWHSHRSPLQSSSPLSSLPYSLQTNRPPQLHRPHPHPQAAPPPSPPRLHYPCPQPPRSPFSLGRSLPRRRPHRPQLLPPSPLGSSLKVSARLSPKQRSRFCRVPHPSSRRAALPVPTSSAAPR